mmetsp:Transcript_50082/g.131770  ORF Transcript_50082/g.131770 Transcript_50082/m.131770 type:complete len:233 (+) Transcript_50082:374-1072(+)
MCIFERRSSRSERIERTILSAFVQVARATSSRSAAIERHACVLASSRSSSGGSIEFSPTIASAVSRAAWCVRRSSMISIMRLRMLFTSSSCPRKLASPRSECSAMSPSVSTTILYSGRVNARWLSPMILRADVCALTISSIVPLTMPAASSTRSCIFTLFWITDSSSERSWRDDFLWRGVSGLDERAAGFARSPLGEVGDCVQLLGDAFVGEPGRRSSALPTCDCLRCGDGG